MCHKDHGCRVRSQADPFQLRLACRRQHGNVSSVALDPTLLLLMFTRTHLFLGKPDTEENRAGFVSTVPLGRPSTPADVANACCYLASDEAAFITGVNLEVSLLSPTPCPVPAPVLTYAHQVDGGRCV